MLVQPNDSALHKVADIDPFTVEGIDWVERQKEMLQIMHDKFGIGLAAPQLGASYNMFVMTHSTLGDIGVYNPQIISQSEDTACQEEGCLTFPLLFFMVTRPASCVVKFQDVLQEEQEMELTGRDAQCFQHEFDHLQGLLFLEYASDMKLQRAMKKRDKTVKKLLKMQKNNEYS